MAAAPDGSTRSGREDWPRRRLGIPKAVCLRHMLGAITELMQVETPGSEGKCVSEVHFRESWACGDKGTGGNTEENGSRMGGCFLQGSLWCTNT